MEIPFPKRKLSHLAAHNRNIGDNALIYGMRKGFGKGFKLRPLELVGNTFGEEFTKHVRKSSGLLFGGGGVIHHASGQGSSRNREMTGTMWNMPMADIFNISKPVVFFAVGYNKFYQDPEPPDVLRVFLEKALDAGFKVDFRNDGSVSRLEEDFPSLTGLFESVPDPGFIAGRIARESYSIEKNSSKVVVQLAADRKDFRYGKFSTESLIRAINKVGQVHNLEFVLLPHTAADKKMVVETQKVWRECGWKAQNLDLHLSNVEDALREYGTASAVISMRGHGQIVPIGAGIPTYSISTHPKVRGLSDELGFSDLCFDLNSETVGYEDTSLSDSLHDFFNDLALLRPKFEEVSFDLEAAGRAYIQEVKEFLSKNGDK